MFGNRLTLFRLAGFPIRVDASWLIVAFLVTWSLAVGLFPQQYPSEDYDGFNTGVYWTMGVIGMLGLFASIVLHELGHAIVARRNDMPMKGITLFVFGGVAEMVDEPPTAGAEFRVAVAGPIVSILIAAGCYGVYLLGDRAAWPVSVTGVLWYLGLINGILVAFNAVPAFPLDGGRVLRSIVWQATGNLKRATKVTAGIGSVFGIVLAVLGVFSFLGGNVIGGIWWFVLGLFLQSAARGAYQQVVVRRAIEGEPISRFMTADVHTVSPDTTVDAFVHDHVYRHHHKLFPVTENGALRGCVTTRDVKNLPREQWSAHRVDELVAACSDGNTISGDADALDAFRRMSRGDTTRLMVVDEGRLVGVVSMKDMLEFIRMKVELED